MTHNQHSLANSARLPIDRFQPDSSLTLLCVMSDHLPSPILSLTISFLPFRSCQDLSCLLTTDQQRHLVCDRVRAQNEDKISIYDSEQESDPSVFFRITASILVTTVSLPSIISLFLPLSLLSSAPSPSAQL